MTKELTFRNAILCEYVAPGAHNKHTLVNVYSGNIIVQKFPAALRFGLYVELSRKSDDIKVLELTIKLANKSVVKGQIAIDPKKDTKDANVVLQSFPLDVKEATTLSVLIGAQGSRKSRVLYKTITQGQIN